MELNASRSVYVKLDVRLVPPNCVLFHKSSDHLPDPEADCVMRM